VDDDDNDGDDLI